MKRILTGMKPTANQFHMGNYFGAVVPLFELVKKHESKSETLFMIATMHALTTLHDPEVLRSNIVRCAKMYLAMMRAYGLEDDDLIIFNQADIPGHAQLTRILQCITNMGFLERMHAYKDALNKGSAGDLSVGTFCYPVLQAIDVVLYDTNYVPVGKDQQQHIEYARDVAQKFNRTFGETFVLPECLVESSVATVPGIDGRKMSKSYNNFLGLLDEPEVLLKKIKKIPTSMQGIDESKNPDECHVYNITKLLISPEENAVLRKKYLDGGLSFKRAKEYLHEKVLLLTAPIQEEFSTISDEEILALLSGNTEKLNQIAKKKVAEVYQKIGFTL